MAATVCCDAEQGQVDKGSVCPGNMMMLSVGQVVLRKYITFVLVRLHPVRSSVGVESKLSRRLTFGRDEEAASYCYIVADTCSGAPLVEVSTTFAR